MFCLYLSRAFFICFLAGYILYCSRMDTPRLKLKTEFFEEDGQIIGIAPEINVGSSGADIVDAQRSL